jgi:hypothetical protein
MVVAREPAGIALMKVLPAAEPCRPAVILRQTVPPGAGS